MISIVITAYKEANTIGKAIEAITCQKNKPTDFSEHSQKPKHKLRRFLIKQKIKNWLNTALFREIQSSMFILRMKSTNRF